MSSQIYDAYRRGHEREWLPGEEEGRAFFRPYTDFVTRAYADLAGAPAPGTPMLDLGCGMGWSALAFRDAGFHTVAADLSMGRFLPPAAEGLGAAEADAARLPFADGAFALVAAHAMLEHVPDPRAVLAEMARVLRPGGVLCVVGPNLLSAAVSVRALWYTLGSRPRRRILLRDPEMDRHPTGDTLPEVVVTLVRYTALLAAKRLSRAPSFHFREPDLRPPLGGDKDAVYLSNPVDLLRFLPTLGCTVRQNGRHGRPRWTALLAGGTWVAAVKDGGGKGDG